MSKLPHGHGGRVFSEREIRLAHLVRQRSQAGLPTDYHSIHAAVTAVGSPDHEFWKTRLATALWTFTQSGHLFEKPAGHFHPSMRWLHELGVTPPSPPAPAA